MITKPNYNIDIILLIINSYLTCEIIWKYIKIFYFTIDVYVSLAYSISWDYFDFIKKFNVVKL